MNSVNVIGLASALPLIAMLALLLGGGAVVEALGPWLLIAPVVERGGHVCGAVSRVQEPTARLVRPGLDRRVCRSLVLSAAGVLVPQALSPRRKCNLTMRSSRRPRFARPRLNAGVRRHWTPRPSPVLLRNATPSVFHQRHIGRVLRSSCNARGRRLASSRGREPQPGRCPPLWPGDL